ncbi:MULTISPECIES: hypothetical protein [unclassified Microbacterium]|uniref:hypothetical protein n=1 Tax=unclassified Microbacterium TaxID=2609290 RepID=UPI00278A6BD8|nr:MULTISPECIES: hypothetical protein [unclassified Microbacterium]MDQ1131216.1 DNA-binding PadR family transcriptional regulator [Microbacterium sp. SORGH_AS_0888]MDQ1206260.1 DNA-binding PadR family transcriptional regulator [Microbacterium sp. SORGH_AS_0862]
MSRQTTKIMVLGIVAYRGPIGAYGIEKVLKEWAVSRWTTIAAPSIYQQLRTLSSRGFIDVTSGESERATQYVCTTKGREQLLSLLRSLLEERDFQPLSLIPLLYFTPTLTIDELRRGLSARVAAIETVLAHEQEFLDQSRDLGPAHAMEILRLTWHGFRADRDWCLDYLARLPESWQVGGWIDCD